MASRTRPLVMVVDGNIDGLKSAAEATRKTLKDMEKSGADFATAFDANITQIGKASERAISDATKRMTDDISRMRREAENAAKLGADFNPAGGFTSSGQQQLADNLTKNAALLRQQEAAYRAVAAANGEFKLQAESSANELRVQAAALTLDAEAAQRNADLLHQVEVQMGATGAAAQANGAKVIGASGAMRSGMMQLSYQANDVAMQFASGTPAMMIFVQQGSQVVQSLQMMSSGTSGLLALLGNPYVVALTTGATVLAMLTAKVIENSDEVGKAKQKLADQAHQTDIAREAQKAYDQTLDGSLDKERKLNDELERRIKNQRELAGEQQRAIAVSLGDALIKQRDAQATFNTALKDKNRAEQALARPPVTSTEEDLKGLEAALSKAQNQFDKAQADLIKANQEVLGYQSSQRITKALQLQEQARGDADPKVAKRNAIEDQQSALTETFVSGNMDAQTYRTRYAKLQKELDDLKGASSSSSPSEQASIGDMTALLQRLFPGVQITSTTGGKHTRGSDHYAGRAIDFVPAGGMGEYSKAEVLQMLKDAGVDIRRNANGVQQFFGPGDKGHSDHFHIAWEGKPSPESADRIAQQRAEKAQRDREALDSAILASKEDTAQLAREGVTDAAELAQLDKEAIDAGLARKLAQNSKLALDHKDLDVLDRANAETRKKAVDEKLARDQSVKAIELENERLSDAAALLELQGQMATTLKERRRIAEMLLSIERQQAINAVQRDLKAGTITPDIAAERTDQVNTVYGLRGQQQKQQLASPIQSWKEKLLSDTADINTAMEQLGANALQGFEDSLLAAVEGTEDLSTAVKRMTASILADLARIALERAIVAAFGFRTGTVPGNSTGSVPGFAAGVISGPGSGTSDSILAWHEGMGLIRVSNGESIITADGTRKHRKLLKAINDNALPAFAGGVVPDVSYPVIPSVSALRAASGQTVPQHFHIDARGAILAADLIAQMRAIGQAAVIGGASLAQQNMQDNASASIPV